MNEKMREERQKRKAAETAAKKARQDLFELRAQQTDETTRARMAAVSFNSMSETLLSTFKSEANIRAEKAEMARRELERDAERMRVSFLCIGRKKCSQASRWSMKILSQLSGNVLPITDPHCLRSKMPRRCSNTGSLHSPRARPVRWRRSPGTSAVTSYT